MPDTKNRPLRVFLCHASQDKPVVRELYQRLKAEGWIEPWLDEEKLTLGQHWTTIIEDALDAADIVIIFLSRNSLHKEGFIQRELNYAWELSLEKPREAIFLIPFRLDDCEVPRYLRSRQWGDYFGEKKEETYKVLLRSLKERHFQKLQLEAEERAHKEAEAKARKNEEEHDRKAVEEPKRKHIERRTWQAREVRERKAAEEQAKNAAEEPQPEKIVQHSVRKPARKVKLIPFGIGVIVLLVLICGIFGVNYIVKHWPTVGVPTSTITPTIASTATFTATPTSTFTPKPPTATPTPTLSVVSTRVLEKDGMVMVYVSEGTFSMGSNSYSDEQPVHTVYLDSFWIDQTEVTNKMYTLCVAAGKCAPPDSSSSYSHSSYYGNLEYDNYPVIYVSWNDASAYCAWADRRLPTEAEWEKAARGTDGRTYPWGEGIDCNKANYNDGSKYCVGDTSAVGSFESGKSFYGAYDLAGNVWEWVADWYSDTYYVSSPASNPTGPASGQSRVLRGGAWSYYDFNVRSASRSGLNPLISDYRIGFRCSRSP